MADNGESIEKKNMHAAYKYLGKAYENREALSDWCAWRTLNTTKSFYNENSACVRVNSGV